MLKLTQYFFMHLKFYYYYRGAYAVPNFLLGVVLCRELYILHYHVYVCIQQLTGIYITPFVLPCLPSLHAECL